MDNRARMLVSVRSAAEAEIAVAAGADLIDVKEPLRGALGAADPEVVAEVVEAVAGRVPVSVALGELRDWRIADALPGAGVRWAKIGLAHCAICNDWQTKWESWVVALPPEMAAVAVIYADWRTAGAPTPQEILQLARKLRCGAVLIDTHDKSHGSLLDLLSLSQLSDLIAEIRGAGMLAVAAGSLNAASIQRILPLFPDYIAVRSAVCGGARTESIEAERVRNLARVLRRRPSATAIAD